MTFGGIPQILVFFSDSTLSVPKRLLNSEIYTVKHEIFAENDITHELFHVVSRFLTTVPGMRNEILQWGIYLSYLKLYIYYTSTFHEVSRFLATFRVISRNFLKLYLGQCRKFLQRSTAKYFGGISG